MKLKRLLIFGVIMVSSAAFSQQREIDSLERLLTTHKSADTVRATLLNARAVYYGYIDPKMSLKLSDETVALAKKLKSSTHLIKAFNCKGLAYRQLGQDSLALMHHQDALRLARNARNKELEIVSMEQLAVIYTNQGKYQKAIDLRNIELRMAKEINDEGKVRAILSNLGVTSFYMADYPKAARYYLKALRLAESSGDKIAQALALQNMGLVYKNMDDFPRSLKYYRSAEKLLSGAGNPEMLSSLMGNMGSLYDQNGQSRIAVEYYRKGIAISKQINDRRSLASHLTNLGITYSGMKDYKLAVSHLLQAKDLYAETPNLNAESIILAELARIFLEFPGDVAELGTGTNERTELAESYALQALSLQNSIGAVDKQAATHSLLSRIYERDKNYSKALDHFKRFHHLQDSINGVEKKEEVVRREMQYESNRKQAIAATEIQRQKIIKIGAFSGSGVLVFGGLVFFVGYRKQQRRRHLAKDALLRTELANAEMKALRLQLNPHFIFNSLNSISDYISKNDAKTADYYLAKFAKLMRGILENSEQEKIPLQNELEMLTIYLDLESARLRQAFTYEIRVSPDIDQQLTMVPPLILQPFVENSIWHGMKGTDRTGRILIDINRDQLILNCSIEDNGVGRNSAEPSKTSYGYRLTKERIELLNKLRKTNAAVHLIDLTQGTRVEIELPIQEHDKSSNY